MAVQVDNLFKGSKSGGHSYRLEKSGMNTRSREKLLKAKELAEIIETRRALEKRETELKEWAKQEARDGVLQAGDIVILVELRTRTQIDRDKMVKELGVSWARKFETVTQYKQVTVKNKAA